MVLLARRQLPQGVGAQLPVGQEAAARVEAARHVDHEAIWDVPRVSAPGDEGGVGGDVGQREVVRRQRS